MGHLTYLALLLPWGLLVVVGQAVLGGAAVLRRGRLLVLVVLPMTAYLVAADALALAQGIWVIHGDRIVGIYIGNVPLEEACFFLLTNLMVVQGLILFNDPAVRARLGRRARPSR